MQLLAVSHYYFHRSVHRQTKNDENEYDRCGYAEQHDIVAYQHLDKKQYQENNEVAYYGL